MFEGLVVKPREKFSQSRILFEPKLGRMLSEKITCNSSRKSVDFNWG